MSTSRGFRECYNGSVQVEVDQSIRIDNTRKATVLAFSNHFSKAVEVTAKTKRRLLKILRQQGKTGHTIYVDIFAATLFLLLRNHLDQLTEIIIDTEFLGSQQQAQITERLVHYAKSHGLSIRSYQVSFHQITKNSAAHELAIAVHRNEKEANEKVDYQDILKLVA